MSLVDMTDRDAVHRRICALKGQRGELDYEQGRWLLAAHRLGVHEALGLGSFAEYAERFGGIDARQGRGRMRVAEALEQLPAIATALKSGELSWSAVRELTRVAIDETEEEWLEAARGRTVREVERMVARQRRGDRPLDEPRAEPPRRVSFEVTAPTWALVHEAREAMTAKLGASVSDDELVAALARALLDPGAQRDDGEAAYSIAITVCDRCKTATQRAGADQVVIDAAALERARCDAEELGRVDVASPGKITRKVPKKVRRAVIRRHGGRCAVPGCNRSAMIELHHTDRLADGGTHDPEKLVPLCGSPHHSAAHVGTLVVRGTYSTGFTFEHADGTRYGGESVSPQRSSVLAQVLEALVAMGFKQREAQGMVDRAKPHVGENATFDGTMRAALKQAMLPSAVMAAREASAEYLAVAVHRAPAPTLRAATTAKHRPREAYSRWIGAASRGSPISPWNMA